MITLEQFRQLKVGDGIKFRDRYCKVTNTLVPDTKVISDGKDLFILREHLMGKTTVYDGWELWELEYVGV